MRLLDLFKKRDYDSDDFLRDLPNAYIKFLKENPDGSGHNFNEYKDLNPEFEGRYWELMSKKELQGSINMKEVGVAQNFEILKLFIQVQKQFGFSEYTQSNVGPVLLNRVESGFVFGQENGDYLYLDSSDNYSVWIYFHDGGDVLRIADSFEQFMN